ncbi:hypothetical protein R9X47_21315 [Wukongibacter baidiensis]|uniref:hypothetical protein n=1 Tax=Wukongibacter baidiensis TaxID=1723361 RepID=UPI003D7F39E7
MMISGLNSYSSFTYMNYNTSTSENSDMAKGPKGPGGPRGGKPPGAPPKGGHQGGPKGPNLDTDDDGYWSKTELEEYASYSSEELGISLDVDDIMSKYDTDSDGKISSDERDALGKDNAFQLPPPEELMKSMMSKPRPNSSDDENNDFNISENTSYIAMSINAYTQSMNYNNESITALFETTA